MKWKKNELDAYLSYRYSQQMEDDEVVISLVQDIYEKKGFLDKSEAPEDRATIEEIERQQLEVKAEYIKLLTLYNPLVRVEVLKGEETASHVMEFNKLEAFVKPLDQESFTWYPTHFDSYEEATHWADECIREIFTSQLPD